MIKKLFGFFKNLISPNKSASSEAVSNTAKLVPQYLFVDNSSYELTLKPEEYNAVCAAIHSVPIGYPTEMFEQAANVPMAGIGQAAGAEINSIAERAAADCNNTKEDFDRLLSEYTAASGRFTMTGAPNTTVTVTDQFGNPWQNSLASGAGMGYNIGGMVAATAMPNNTNNNTHTGATGLPSANLSASPQTIQNASGKASITPAVFIPPIIFPPDFPYSQDELIVEPDLPDLSGKVVLEDWAKEKGGTATSVKKRRLGFLWNYDTGDIKVTINGKEKIYTSKDYMIYDGKAFIDSSILETDFPEKIYGLKYENYKMGDKSLAPKFGPYDNDFPYDSDAVATDEDKQNWKDWGTNSFVGGLPVWVKGILKTPAKWFANDKYEQYKDKFVINLKDATKAYNRYRDGSGKDMKIDYERAYKEDGVIKSALDGEVDKMKKAVSIFYNGGAGNTFEIIGDKVSIDNGDNENWQKTIGGHSAYAHGKITINEKTGKATMKITFTMEDMYNFNRNQYDIGTGTPDYINGRFQELGWAKEFKTYGSFEKTVDWNL